MENYQRKNKEKGAIEMGVSGPNTTDNDAFYIYLNALFRHLIKDVIEGFSEIEASNPDFDVEVADKTLMPAFDIINTLCQQYGVFHIVDKAQIKKWQDVYLRFYDENNEEGSQEQARRQVIENTFSQFHDFGFDTIKEK